MYEHEIERLSEWVAEHTIAGAKVTAQMSSVPQEAVEKWLCTIETHRAKVGVRQLYIWFLLASWSD